MQKIIVRMLKNKHTSFAALIGFALQVVAILWPETKPKCDEILKLAIIYGFAMAGDSTPVPKSQEDKRQGKLLLVIGALGLLAAGIFASGCAGTSGLVRALAKDPAIVSAEVVTPWGHSRLTRVGLNTNSVSITPSGADVNKK